MSTTYIFEVGYQYEYTIDEVWEKLKEVVVQACENFPEFHNYVIADENIPSVCPCGCGITITTMCYAYTTAIEDKWIGFQEDTGFSGLHPYVWMLSSGDREYKGKIRRAFCRFVIENMHKYDMEINLRVV